MHEANRLLIARSACSFSVERPKFRELHIQRKALYLNADVASLGDAADSLMHFASFTRLFLP